MILKLFLIFAISVNFVLCQYKITPEIRAQCKEFYCKKGYVYDVFFAVNEGHRPKDMIFELHIAIKAPNNGHILMSSTKNPKMTESVYEIVVGAGGNSFSELRRMRMKMGKSMVDTRDILNPKQYVPFYIKAYKDGYIKFGKEGEDLALLSYYDPVPLQINYFSFAAWNGIEARVLYDCPINNTQVNVSIAVPEEPKSNTNRLRDDLLKDYNPYQISLAEDEEAKQVLFNFNIRSVKYDAKKFQLETHGKIILQWIDNKLKWDPKDYGNVSVLYFQYRDIWLPDFVLYNSLDSKDLYQDSSPARVTRQGSVVKEIYFKVKTVCVPEDRTRFLKWPRDEHTCDLIFGGRQVVLYNVMNQTIQDFPMDDTDFISTEWEKTNVTLTQDTIGYNRNLRYFYHEDESEEDDDEKEKRTMVLQISMKRISKTYILAYYTPLFCSILILLLTFFMTSSSPAKISLLCFDLILVFTCLSQIIKQLPLSARYAPNIVWFYYWVLFGDCICIGINVFVIYLRTEPKPWPIMNEELKRFLIASSITTALGLPDVKMNKNYSMVDEDQSPPKEDDEQVWEMLSMVIDRMMLIAFIIASAVIVLQHY